MNYKKQMDHNVVDWEKLEDLDRFTYKNEGDR